MVCADALATIANVSAVMNERFIVPYSSFFLSSDFCV